MTHACASACSGLAAATVSTPTDVVKTRIMHQIQHQSETGGYVTLIAGCSVYALSLANPSYFTTAPSTVYSRLFAMRDLLVCIAASYRHTFGWLLGRSHFGCLTSTFAALPVLPASKKAHL